MRLLARTAAESAVESRGAKGAASRREARKREVRHVAGRRSRVGRRALPLRPSRRSQGKQPDVKLSFLEEFGAAVGTQTDEKRAGGSDFDVFGRAWRRAQAGARRGPRCAGAHQETDRVCS